MHLEEKNPQVAGDTAPERSLAGGNLSEQGLIGQRSEGALVRKWLRRGLKKTRLRHC